MRQFDHAAAQAFLRDAIASGDLRRELAAADGSRLVFERAPAPGVAETLTEVAPDGTAHVHSRTFAAAASPRAGYPVGAPFLPGWEVSVFDPGGDGNYVLAWEGVDDPAGVTATLVRESVAQGWTEPEPAAGALGRAAIGVLGAAVRATTGASFTVRRLLRDGRQRLITAGGRGSGRTFVTLGETPERAEPVPGAPGAA